MEDEEETVVHAGGRGTRRGGAPRQHEHVHDHLHVYHVAGAGRDAADLHEAQAPPPQRGAPPPAPPSTGAQRAARSRAPQPPVPPQHSRRQASGDGWQPRGTFLTGAESDDDDNGEDDAAVGGSGQGTGASVELSGNFDEDEDDGSQGGDSDDSSDDDDPEAQARWDALPFAQVLGGSRQPAGRASNWDRSGEGRYSVGYTVGPPTR